MRSTKNFLTGTAMTAGVAAAVLVMSTSAFAQKTINPPYSAKWAGMTGARRILL
jgi:hypothetical protein